MALKTTVGAMFSELADKVRGMDALRDKLPCGCR